MKSFLLRGVIAIAALALATVFFINVGRWDDVKTFARDVVSPGFADILDSWGVASEETVTAVKDKGEDFAERLRTGEDYDPDWSTISDMLGNFVPPIAQRHPDYQRAEFGDGWLDLDGDECDTRNEILARDLTNVKLDSNSCTVLSGTLADPYTGTTIDFTRGSKTSSAVQIDHVIPLSLAWDLGAWKWSDAQREEFANDPENLLAVDGPTNGSKSDSPISEWMPPNAAYACDYTARYVEISDKYDLAMEKADRKKIESLTASCAG